MRDAAKSHQMILFLFCASFVIQLLSSALPMGFILTAGQAFSLLLPLLLYVALTGGRFAERLSLKPFKGRFLALGIGVTLLLQPFLMLLATVVEKTAGNPMEAFLESMAFTPAWMTVTGLAFMPALIEELVFRGALLNGYRRLPLWSAAVLNGVVFGMFHMNLYQFSYAMVLGIFFSAVTRISGSVIPAMAMHFLNNGISVMLIYQAHSGWYSLLEQALDTGTAFGPGMAGGILVGAASLGGAFWLFRRQAEEELPEDHAERFIPAALIYDWSLAALILIFLILAVAEPLKALM